MISKKILEDRDTFSLLIQLTDIATAAHERGDTESRDNALEEIREIKNQIKGQMTESSHSSHKSE
ncbi:hypothetical protein L1994_04615 [Methanomicrobium antiquum]|uniref:Uncharacterized protein n=1 Tax=Methanomicrobium antiquum TaxID=487686 RepID=A0AAF0JNK8_9EURY|nr:hypothetical protein [Methanomicrobium antiquum]MDD3977119.1 hypothetical protein [Methanomicrobium sp.]WFN37675.1 hypothetical protein L1994_04615 [Methanomicrobium antiquum]